MKIIIIGGSFAGIQAAITCREMNKECEIIILEATESLAYYPIEFRSRFRPINDRQHFDEIPMKVSQLSELEIDCYLDTKVTQINPDKKWLIYNKNGIIEQLNYDYLVLAMGSRQYIGINDALIHQPIIRLDDLNRMDESLSFIKQAEKVLIIGGGQYGIEASELYLKLGKQVTILEAGEHLNFKLFDEWIINDLQEDLIGQGVILKCNESYQKISIEEEKIMVKSHRDIYQTDAVQFAMNVRPNTKLVEDFLRLNPDGTIWTNQFLQTSQSSIFACGDLIKWHFGEQNEEYYLPLISHAKLSGKIVGLNIFGKMQSVPKTPRAVMMTILDYDYFSAGKTIQELEYSQTNYYSSRDKNDGISIQCLSQTSTGEILGIQIRGGKELQLTSLFTLALTAIQAGLTDQFLASQMNVYQGQQALIPEAWFETMNQHWQGRQQMLHVKEQ